MTLASVSADSPWTRSLLYCRTVAGLRPRQWAYLLASRLGTRKHAAPARIVARIDPEAVARFGAGLRIAGPGDAGARIAGAERLAAGRLSLLGVEEALATLDWGGTPVSPLWTYHLHYLDWAVDLAWAYRLTGRRTHRDLLVGLLGDWAGATEARVSRAWEPYPHATRTLNLARVIALVGDDLEPEWSDRIGGALGGYAANARRSLELHLEGNHLWRDVAAWVVSAELLDGPHWERPRREALRWWRRVRREQLLADGGHEERSPLYHALALQDLVLTLLALPAGESRADIHEDGKRMAPLLSRFFRSDGTPHLFNDSAAREDLDPGLVRNLARAAGLPVPDGVGLFHLPATGYAGVIAPAQGDRLIVDCGIPAPRHQPGHLHCDLLAFEFDLRGRPLLVNGGVRGYEGDPMRGYFRGTASHNTVKIGGYDQSEVWAVFRVGRMARLLEHSCAPRPDGGWGFTGSMSPYAPSGAVHRRAIEWRPGRLEVSDVVDGIDGVVCQAFLHFAPEVDVRPDGADRFRATLGGMRVDVTWEGATQVTLRQGSSDPVQGWYAGAFGTLRSSPCLVASFTGRGSASVRCRVQEVRS